MSVSAPSGASILMYGNKTPLQLVTNNYNIGIEQSCAVWINRSAATIQFTLPVNAPSGMAALFVRAGGQINVNPGLGRIWNSPSGLFKNVGESVFLTASGSKYAVASNGQNGWIPIMEKGTIL